MPNVTRLTVLSVLRPEDEQDFVPTIGGKADALAARERLIDEWGPQDPLVIATGGLAGLVAPHCRRVHEVDPFLTLKGIVCADQHLAATAGDRA